MPAGHCDREPLQAAARVSLPPLQVAGAQLVPELPAVNVHPLAGAHPSTVQTLVSAQVGGGPPLQEPPEQASAVVQAF
jgi:hypothetical protein